MSLIPDTLDEVLQTAAYAADEAGVGMFEFHVNVLVNRGVASVNYSIGSCAENNTTAPSLNSLLDEFIRRLDYQGKVRFESNPVVRLLAPPQKGSGP